MSEPTEEKNPARYLTLGACLSAGMLIGIALGVGLHTPSAPAPIVPTDWHDSPSEYAAELLKTELFNQGFLAEVKCPIWTSTLLPLCKVTMQPKSGGPVAGPFSYRGRTAITWEAY